MSQLYVLFEHAAGYALFRVTEFEEIAMFLPEVEKSVQDLSKFRHIVSLVAFMPFKTAKDALENMNSISEGILHPDLQLFLETNVPKSKKKKQPILLGVADVKIGSIINEALGIACDNSGVVPEIIRGTRLHFHNLVSGFKEEFACKAQLGLGHNYSRAKVKFNVNRVDNMIIQSISLLDQLDKDINTFAMRMREWYSYHFPELIRIVPENSLYAQVVSVIQDRKSIPEDATEKLEEVLMDSDKVKTILEVARSSMGMEISPIDLMNIQAFATRVIALIKYRKELMEYLKSKMHNIAPNLATLIGETVGARLISHAGSLTNLAKCPASTVQILGAEKALFRALKTRGNTPKYGLIFHSTFIGRAAKQNKGRISRFLANKCSMASRIDCFSEIPTEIFGQKLKQQVEDRLKFYESGTLPAKNIDVMSEATDEASVVQAELSRKKRKKEKKEKKKRQQELEALTNCAPETSMETSLGNALTDEAEVNDESSKKKKKKKRKSEDGTEDEILANSFVPADDSIGHALSDETEVNGESLKKKKKKKRKHEETEEVLGNSFVSADDSLGNSVNDEAEVNGESLKKKKKKKRKSEENVGDEVM